MSAQTDRAEIPTYVLGCLFDVRSRDTRVRVSIEDCFMLIGIGEGEKTLCDAVIGGQGKLLGQR